MGPRTTFETIAPFTIEESYEIADAVARGDMNNLKEELGDLCFFKLFFRASLRTRSKHSGSASNGMKKRKRECQAPPQARASSPVFRWPCPA
jgi:NTP pyrophosphatase (non-canonical NTP hydrolase)